MCLKSRFKSNRDLILPTTDVIYDYVLKMFPKRKQVHFPPREIDHPFNSMHFHFSVAPKKTNLHEIIINVIIIQQQCLYKVF